MWLYLSTMREPAPHRTPMLDSDDVAPRHGRPPGRVHSASFHGAIDRSRMSTVGAIDCHYGNDDISAMSRLTLVSAELSTSLVASDDFGETGHARSVAPRRVPGPHLANPWRFDVPRARAFRLRRERDLWRVRQETAGIGALGRR